MLRGITSRIKARVRLRADVGIWFHPEYSGPWRNDPPPVGHIEPRRGDLVVDRLLRDQLLSASDVRQAEPIAMEALARFHSWAYLERSTQPDNLARIFGTEPGVLRSEDLVRSIRRACGGTLEAARAVANGRLRTGVNLGGGFHHAEPELGSGFCVYNDIGAAIRTLQAEGWDEPILVVDLDVHQGNGNSVAFEADDRVKVYSVHGSVWSHRRDRVHREIHLHGAVTDERYQAVLRTTLEPWMEQIRPGIVFYVAGADVLAGDRLGSFWLTMDGVLQRDRYVADLAKRHGAGLVVTLGGGYSRQAWVTHYNFVRYLLTDRTSHRLRVESRRESFDRVHRALDPLELQREPDDLNIDLDPSELFGQLNRSSPARRLLDYYSKHGIEMALEQYGVIEKVKKRGYEDFRIELELSDLEHQRVLVDGLAWKQWHRIIELVVRPAEIEVPEQPDEKIESLWVEWLLLQDPIASFSLDRPPLPGQAHPGLGLARDFVELLVRMCKRLELGALVDVPAHYHNGVAANSEFHFLDPDVEGRTRALMTVLAGISVPEASRLVDEGSVQTADGEPFEWVTAPHVMAFDERLRAYFRSVEYREKAVRATHRYLQLGLHVQADALAVPLRPTSASTSPPSSSQ